MTALVYDDDADVAGVLQAQLGRLGLPAHTVSDRDGFERALREQKPSFIFLDLALGSTDAVEVISMLSASHFDGRIVLVTGAYTRALDHVRSIGARSGLDIAGVLKKPFRLQNLRQLIGNLFAARDAGEVVAQSQPVDVTLSEALASNWIEFWYQPEVDLGSGRIVGAEALARLRHPTLGVRSAGPLLAAASSEDLSELLLRAFDDVLASAPRLAADRTDLRFSINVSGRSLGKPDLLDRLRERRAAAAAPRLVLEITETDVIDDQHAAQAFATRAVLHGFEIAIDDFGQGYAMFERLRALPFTELKLEHSMVHGCATDQSLRHICEATARLAIGFGARAVAEGIERRADLDLVRMLGFHLGQGFLFSRALPPDRFAALPPAYDLETIGAEAGGRRTP